WVTVTNGPKSNDLGSRRDAIIRSEYLDVGQSPARTPGGSSVSYVHPSCLDETKEGSFVIGFNGGTSEGEGSNRVFVTRKPDGGEWSAPEIIEPEGSIDYGIIYQPRHNNNDTILCTYWWPAGCCGSGAYRYSTDDGLSWSDRIECPSSNLWTSGVMTTGMNHPLEFPNGDLWFAADDLGPQEGGTGHALITKVPWGSYTNTSNWTATDIHQGASVRKILGSWLVLSADYSKIMYCTRDNPDHSFTMSTDGGQTWNGWTSFNTSNNCGISTVSLSPDNESSPLHGYHLVTGSRHHILRVSLDVYVSSDPESNQWNKVLELNKLDSPPKVEENADPTIFQSRSDEGKVHLLFTGRGGDNLKYYLLDAYELCGVTATKSARDKMYDNNSGILFRRQHNELRIGFDAVQSKGSIKIYDMRGKTVFNRRIGNSSVVHITLNTLIAGNYVVQVRRGNSVVQKHVAVSQH
ncbi:MAG: T9SS type A sorting domain-containing protein, partial [Chitinivibrionales bacterium]|nr:T9SS type A sorting domain-containing protein [Chitinivibrionales bacterium]